MLTWTQNRQHSERFMWISGQAGLGKTSIATSLCQRLDRIQALAGSFFCRHDDPDSSDPLRLVNNLVHTIALKLPPYAHEVAKAIRTDRSLCTSHFSLRYEGLIKGPLQRLKSLSAAKTLVIVIDALDEFGDHDSRQTIFEKLHEISCLVPWLRVVFTSRPERRLQEYFQTNCSHEPIIHLQTYDASIDIRAYIERHLGELSRTKSWPQSSLDQLCGMAEGVFLWAVLATSYIQKSNFSALSRLQRVLDNQQSPIIDHFDTLYTRALTTLMVDNEDEIDIYARCIAAILATAEQKPLTASSLQYLPLVVGRVEQPTLEHIMKDLGPLLIIMDGRYAKFHHSTFKDFISDRSRSGKYFIRVDRYDGEHGDCCLRTMQEDLRFNICELESSHLRNQEVPDLRVRVRSHITPALKYACIHWIDHFIASPTPTMVKAMKAFLEGPQLMYWIEALSLLGRLDVAMDGLFRLRSLELGSDDWVTIVSWIYDLQRFLLVFHDIIVASTPHLYISALAFAPAQSTTAQRMRPHFPKTITIPQGGDLYWHPCINNIHHPHAIQTLSISPDGLIVIVGYLNGLLGMWDEKSGTRIKRTFIGHTDSISCIVFSPKGNRIASSSHDATIRVWDVAGNIKTSCVLTGHSGPVHSIAFSPNANFIASGSSDKTIRLWDPDVMRPISEPYVGHSDDVNSVAFSPDGTKLASGSRDKTIRIWLVDPNSPKLAGNPLLITGHTGRVTCVAFSPDGLKIASGSEDKTLQVWDAQSGSKIKDHTSPAEHSETVTSLEFSPNGTLVASSASDGAIQLWDVTTLKAFSRPFGHTKSANGVAFFPNGSRIMSGAADQTTRVWDVNSCPKAVTASPLVGLSAPALSISISSDGTRITSVSSDHTVCTWDAQTGAPMGSPDTLPPESRVPNLKCVAISPDGVRIAFAGNNNVKLWNTSTRSDISSYQHDSPIQCITFSPDGALIAFGCANCTIYLWEVARWKIFGNPLQGHSNSVISVAFSPDGASLASACNHYMWLWDIETQSSSNNPLSRKSHGGGPVVFSHCGTQLASVSTNSVSLWDRKTGNRVKQLSNQNNQHTCQLSIATFSPNGPFILCGSRDGCIKLWNTRTGQMVGNPFAKHAAEVTSIAFFPDGNYFLAGSQDGTIQAWSLDISYSGVERAQNTYGHHIWPANPHNLSPHPHHPGWVTHDQRSLAFWLPPHYQQPEDFLSGATRLSRPPVCLNYSDFVHGTDWASIASDSIKQGSG